MVNVIKDPKVPSFENKTKYSAGFDLYNIGGDITLKPLEKTLISTGIKIDMMGMKDKCAALVFPRSGVSLKTNLRVCNSVGLCDQDYRGEVKVIIQNIGNTDETIKDLDRIAQLVFVPIIVPNVQFETEFSDTTERGEGGFGSTGK